MGTSGKRKVVLLTLYENIFISRFGEKHSECVICTCLARATPWMAACGPDYRSCLTDQSSGVRCLFLEGCLVSRLCCVLRHFGRWQESVRDGGTARAPANQSSKKRWETRPPMRCRIRPARRPVGNASRFASGFSSPLDQKLTYLVRGHAVDVVNDEEEEGTK